MNLTDPTTWRDTSSHSILSNTHYDGDVLRDLTMLRDVAIAVKEAFPGYLCELTVLDDATIYVTFRHDSEIKVEVHPALTDIGTPVFLWIF